MLILAHPITSPDAKAIRDRVRNFLHNDAYSVRNSNIVFVCGGNDDVHMRSRFREYAKDQLTEYKIYLPEYSFQNMFSLADDGLRFIDLSKFEATVAALSCCVILFPEAPGSLVELGLFSANNSIVERLLLVIDSHHDNGKDSFIMLGPVNKINIDSRYRPVFIDSYDEMNFDKIKNRIKERFNISSRHKKAEFEGRVWGEISYFDKLSIIHWLVEICRLSESGQVAGGPGKVQVPSPGWWQVLTSGLRVSAGKLRVCRDSRFRNSGYPCGSRLGIARVGLAVPCPGGGSDIRSGQ